MGYKTKVGSVFSKVIWPERRMGQYRDDDHREYASHFRTHILNIIQLLTHYLRTRQNVRKGS